MLENVNILGVINNYKIGLKFNGTVRELNINNIENALKMVGLEKSVLEKTLDELTISEKFKIDLVTKLNKDIIIVGNLSNCLIKKEMEYMKKLFLKLSNEYKKKIIVIDKDVETFFNLTNSIVVMKDKEIIYKTEDFFDKELYKHTSTPKIIDFIFYVNEKNIKLDKNVDIYELIKNIYRSVS